MKRIANTIRPVKFIAAIVIVLIICISICACNKPTTYQMDFVAEGLNIPSITAEAGAQILPPADPYLENRTFEGWYDNADFSGDPVTLPTVMPAQNVTYYAKFSAPRGSRRVEYVFNLPVAQPTGEVTPSYGNTGDTVIVKDGKDYGTDGWLFVGWSTKRNGLVSQFGSKIEGQYLAGDSLVLGEEDVTLYAQWAYELDSAQGFAEGELYLYSEYIGKGNGAVILVREGKPNKLGFVAPRESEDDEYYDFEFFFNENDGYGTVGSVKGRIYDDNTYALCDGLDGMFLYYDYITKDYMQYVFTADGYGEAIISQVIFDQIKTLYYGLYEYDDEYGDYNFTGRDVQSGESVQIILSLNKGEINIDSDDNDFIGAFSYMGMESGSYLLYENGDMLNYKLELNGYGVAKWLSYDPVSDTTAVVAEGEYCGTPNYQGESGEWVFTSADGSYTFKFIINVIRDSISGNVPVYIEYDEDMNMTLTGDGASLYLDGYGSAEYTAEGGIEYVGYFKVDDGDGSLLIYTPYIVGDDGSATAGGEMFFVVNWQDRTFTVSAEGYIVSGTKLISYQGNSNVIVIPDEVTQIADGVFNYFKTGVSIVSATIPAGVTSIGELAFQNNYTLRRVVFLSKTPITIDWSNDVNPFRWGSGLIIVVPEGCQEAYKAAWTDCPYAIKGSVEVTILPEFEIERGVLVRYNVQPNAPETLELTIPDGVTSIASFVFRGLEGLKSIDLAGVTVVGEGAFEMCYNLESVDFANVTQIGIGAFAACENLGSVSDGIIRLPSVVDIGESAFAGCYELRRVIIGANIESIGSYAFTETNMQLSHGPLFVELTGDAAPTMGGKVFNGNIATRIQVNDINVVLDCYNEPTFAPYNRHLYIESGDEKGLYLDGADPLELDGRAFILSTYVMMYCIEGENITFYEFDEENAAYYIIEGTYKNGIISFNIGVTEYNFKKYSGISTYTSEDGKYTLTCDPTHLLPENFEDTGYAGYADAVFNGRQVKVYVSGYNVKRISSYLDEDGKYYDFDIAIVGEKLVYERKVADRRVHITASDGSLLTLHFTANYIYVYGTLKIVADIDGSGNEIMLPENEDYGVYVKSAQGDTYVFERQYKNKKFTITVTVDGDTFTYSYTQQ